MTYCSKCGAEVNDRFCPKCGNDCAYASSESVTETVEQLYGLRAGLSAIAMESDKAKQRKNCLDDTIEKTQQMINESYSKCNKTKEKIGRINQETEGATDSKAQAAWTSYKKYEKIGKILGIMGIVCLIIGAIGLLGAVCEFAQDAMDNSVSEGPMRRLAPISLVLAIWGVGCLIVCAYYLEEKQHCCLSRYNKISEALNCRLELPKLEEEIAETYENANTLNNKLYETKKDLKDSMHYYGTVAENMYNALAGEYSSLLDTRDWQNLDLVIFYLETGRANTMKEALQQVDRQRQTDSIVYAIKNATAQINNTIQRGMKEIQGTIIKCAQVLSVQLQTISNQQLAIQGQLREQMQITEQSMKLALKEKSNVSSEQLVDDIHQLRIYADNAEIIRRNS